MAAYLRRLMGAKQDKGGSGAYVANPKDGSLAAYLDETFKVNCTL